MYIHNISIDTTSDSTFIRAYKNGLVDFVLLHMKTPCMLFIRDISYTITQPSILFMTRDTPHKYFPTGHEYRDDYLHFNVKDPEVFLSKLTFPTNIPIPISNDLWISDLFKTIQHEHQHPTKFSFEILTHLCNLLVLRIGEQWAIIQESYAKGPHYEDLLQMRNAIFELPEQNWHIDTLAREIHLSPSYFQMVYKQTFGVTCMADVIHARIAKAKSLLASTDLSINEIALETGYNQSYHFIRQFKKNTGLTPGAYRKTTL